MDQARYRVTWEDHEMIEALAATRLNEDPIYPPNLRAFFYGLPAPERERLKREAKKRIK